MDIGELREKAKASGIKSYWNKKEEKLLKELAALEEAPIVEDSSIKINTDADKRGFLKRCGLDFDRLKSYAAEKQADSLVYDARMRAFECYKSGQFIDHLHVSMFD